MSGFDYFKKCVFENYANFEGRARRSEYWYFTLFNAIIGYFIQALGLVLESPIFMILSIIVSFALFLPALSVMARRLHDIDKSGWNFLWVITIVGIFVVLYWLVQDSQYGPNKYGQNPKGIGNDTNKIDDQLTEELV